MITLKSNIAKGLLVVLATYPQLSAAQEFTAAQVLEWDQASRTDFIQNSITMVGFVVSNNGERPGQGKCIRTWFGEPGQHGAAVSEVSAYFEQYGDHHPQIVLLALIEAKCGRIFD